MKIDLEKGPIGSGHRTEKEGSMNKKQIKAIRDAFFMVSGWVPDGRKWTNAERRAYNRAALLLAPELRVGSHETSR